MEVFMGLFSRKKSPKKVKDFPGKSQNRQSEQVLSDDQVKYSFENGQVIEYGLNSDCVVFEGNIFVKRPYTSVDASIELEDTLLAQAILGSENVRPIKATRPLKVKESNQLKQVRNRKIATWQNAIDNMSARGTLTEARKRKALKKVKAIQRIKGSDKMQLLYGPFLAFQTLDKMDPYSIDAKFVNNLESILVAGSILGMRDLKPGNVLYGPRQKPILIDCTYSSFDNLPTDVLAFVSKKFSPILSKDPKNIIASSEQYVSECMQRFHDNKGILSKNLPKQELNKIPARAVELYGPGILRS